MLTGDLNLSIQIKNIIRMLKIYAQGTTSQTLLILTALLKSKEY